MAMIEAIWSNAFLSNNNTITLIASSANSFRLVISLLKAVAFLKADLHKKPTVSAEKQKSPLVNNSSSYYFDLIIIKGHPINPV